MNAIVNILFLGIILFFVKDFLPAKGIKNITINELKNELKTGNKQLIDVRTKAEYEQFQIPNFKNIPLHSLKKETKGLEKDKEVFVICQSGMRSRKAARILKGLGFERVTNVKGGVSAWF